MFTIELSGPGNPRYMINLPTKKHWRGRSRLEYVSAGLEDLVLETRRLSLRLIAIPPLGRGLGGLAWSEVRPLVERAFVEEPDLVARIYVPS